MEPWYSCVHVAGTDAESAAVALRHLEDIDSLLANESTVDQSLFASYLRSGQDLAVVMTEKDDELQRLCATFIQANVEAAEDICQLYNAFSECEKNIVGLEEETVSIQRTLASSAEDIVMMQQRSVELSRSVDNRRKLSGKIIDVYTALQECDRYCEEIATREVDQCYLATLSELCRKLVFLSANKELQHSAVDNEIRPKLIRAASKAGDKLHHFLSTQILSLAEDTANVEVRQQALEDGCQFAFAFLQQYNPSVARSIVQLYTETMPDVLVQRLSASMRLLSLASQLHAHPLDPIVSACEAEDIMANRDAGAPPGNQVAVEGGGFPGRTMAHRDRSVSQHMSPPGEHSGRTDSLHLLREGTAEDSVMAVAALRVRHGKLQLDPAARETLSSSRSWVWQLVRSFQVLVNTCVSECRFIGGFFCASGDVEGGEDYDTAEAIARAVLEKALHTVEAGIRSDFPMIMDCISVLAGLRVLDIVKRYICASFDPNPLLLLSGVMATTKSCLLSTLRTVLRNDETVLSYLPTMKLAVFSLAPKPNAAFVKLLENKVYAVTLGPHPVVLKTAEVLGQLELLNTVPFEGSTMQDANTEVYDASLSTFLNDALCNLLKWVTSLSHRHPCSIAQRFFTVYNTWGVLCLWQALPGVLKVGHECDVAFSPAHSTPMPNQGSAALHGSRPNMLGSRDAPLSHSDSSRPSVGGVWAQAAHMKLLEDRLDEELSLLADTITDAHKTFRDLLAFSNEIEEHLGAEEATERSSTLPSSGGPTDVPPSLGEEQTVAIAQDFRIHWREEMETMISCVRRAVAIPLTAAAGGKSSFLRCKDLVLLILRMCLHIVAEANAKFCSFAVRVYGGNNELQAQTVNSVTVIHEAQRLLHGV